MVVKRKVVENEDTAEKVNGDPINLLENDGGNTNTAIILGDTYTP